MIDLFIYAFINILVVATFFIIGHLIWKYYYAKFELISSENYFLSFSQKVIVGFVALVSLVAIFITNGKTVSLISFILVLLWPLINKGSPEVSGEKKSSNIYFPITIISVFLLVFLFHFFETNPTGDMLFYSKLALSMYDVGVESPFAAYVNYKIPDGMVLYHYGELWLTGMISLLFGIDSIKSLTFVTYPLFHGLSFITLLGIFSSNGLSIWKSIIYSFCVLYGTTLIEYQIEILTQGERASWYYSIPYFSSSKLLVIYPFILLAFSFFKNNKLAFSILISWCIIFYTPTVISLLGGVSGVILSVIFGKEKLKIKGLKVLPLLIPVVACIAILALSSFYGDKSGTSTWKELIFPMSTYINEIGDFVLVFLKYLIRPFVMYPLILLGLLYVTIKDRAFLRQKKMIFILFSLFSSAVFIAFFQRTMPDSTQILSNILPALMLVVSTAILLEVKNPKWIIFVIVIFGGINLYYVMPSSKKQLSPIETQLQKFAEENGQFNWGYISNKYWSSWTINQNIFSHPFLLSSESILPLELAPLFENKKGQDTYCKRSANRNAPTVLFMEKNETSVSNILVFLYQLNIKYIYIEDENNVPEEFLRFLAPKIIEGEKGLWEIVDQ
jgi:hypothetical protein